MKQQDKQIRIDLVRGAICGLGVSFLLAGCAPQTNSGTPPATSIALPAVSPLVGNWTGEAKLTTGSDLTKLANALTGDQMTGASKLTLQANGTGYLKVAKSPERPITWRQDGKRVVLEGAVGKTDASGNKSSSDKSDNTFVGTLTESGTSMTIDLGQAKVSLTKEASGS
jgi:hypothetical protein